MTSNRLDKLRTMRDFIDREIQAELDRQGGLSDATNALIARACALYDTDAAAVCRGSRTVHDIRARHAAAWLLRRHGMSLPQIGRALGCDHTTALYACRKIDASPAVKAMLLGLERAS